MKTATLEIVHTYSVVQCTHEGCGVHFALDDDFIRARQENRKTFWCPNGHTRWYPGKTKEQEQRERAERLQQQLTRRESDLQQERKSHIATKGQLTKARKRAAHGVCPCCSRTFANVNRHIANQHPDYMEAHG